MARVIPDKMQRKRSSPTLAPRRHKRRGKGRPAAGQQNVGRDALIDRTCELLKQMPPNKITRAEVARQMRVDPSLIRYYFRDRETLLLAAVEKVTAEFNVMLAHENEASDGTPESRLRARISAFLKFEIRYPFFNRLLIDEIAHLDAPSSVQFLDSLTKNAVASYASIINAGVKAGSFRQSDPTFLFMAVVGICEFFVNGRPILRIAQGTQFDEHESDRYAEFICDLLLNGLKTPIQKRA
jgi:TetR/AcrR family transcriptional regulator